MCELLKHVQSLMDTNNQSENLFFLISLHRVRVQQKSRSMKSPDILSAAASAYSLDCLALTIGNRHAGDVEVQLRAEKALTSYLPCLVLLLFEVELHGLL